MNFILNNKKYFYVLFGIILLPFLSILFEFFVKILFYSGEFVGTYLRILYEKGMC
jgi:hypothetical protein